MDSYVGVLYKYVHTSGVCMYSGCSTGKCGHWAVRAVVAYLSIFILLWQRGSEPVQRPHHLPHRLQQLSCVLGTQARVPLLALSL